ncbi:MAG: hypothetical protein LBL81_00930 [Tannerella sp.]|jgi:hypothetical protein|nr:hypothetical protein [Tannerella sp.]
METTIKQPRSKQREKGEPVNNPEERELLARFGVRFDEENRPVNTYTSEEIFDELGNKLIAHYGEAFRKELNEGRALRGMKPL